MRSVVNEVELIFVALKELNYALANVVVPALVIYLNVMLVPIAVNVGDVIIELLNTVELEFKLFRIIISLLI